MVSAKPGRPQYHTPVTPNWTKGRPWIRPALEWPAHKGRVTVVTFQTPTWRLPLRSGQIHRIAVNTGGGDAPGLNAVIRAVVIAALSRGWEVVGIPHGYTGLFAEDGHDLIQLDRESVRGITHIGGTILGTSNRGNPFAWPVRTDTGEIVEVDRSTEILEAMEAAGIDALVAIGGDGSLAIAHELAKRGLPVVGVPKTIDNDVESTFFTFGFMTACSIATDAIDRLHSTAESHQRVMVLELMGRNAGWIAMHSGIGGSADVILIPEIPFDIELVCAKVMEREQQGRHFSIVVAAEGAAPRGGGQLTVEGAGAGREEARLGGVAEWLSVEIEKRTGKETRHMVLGHLQRGGGPDAYDRLLALRFGAAAVRCVEMRAFGTMVALQPPRVVAVPLAEAISKRKLVPLDGDLVRTARDLGINLGD